MNVAPVINCLDEICLHARWKQSGEIGAREVHFDISDGIFSPVVTVCTPALLRELLKENPGIRAEVHLMVRNPEAVVDSWLEAGAKKIIVHIEAVRDPQLLEDHIQVHNAELILGVTMDTDVKKLIPYLGSRSIRAVHLLEVPIGFSGGIMSPNAADRIRFMRDAVPHVLISIDGGVTEETARRAARAGADRVVSSSFIWNSTSPKEAYELLLKVSP